MPEPGPQAAWWAEPAPALLRALGSTPEGLAQGEAQARAAREGPNLVVPVRSLAGWSLLARQVSGPLVLILLAGAAIALVVGQWVQALTILVIVAGSAAIGFAQEWRASRALQRLRSRLALGARVWRDGQLQVRPAAEVVAGDVVELAAGNLVPADGVVLQARDFLVTEASLTGESLPVEKRPGVCAADAPLAERRHCVHLGSSVRSGTARVLVVRTGPDTLLAEVSARLAAHPPETAFARGVRHFGDMLLRVMLVVVVAVLVANQLLGRPVVDSLLFAVALAVGLSPELLPAIVSVSLARGARALAASGVLVRRLEAIEDLGGMDVLCTDKTGTLTAGEMTLAAALDPEGRESGEVLGLAYLLFVNHPQSPVGWLYGGMAILVVSTITHLYSVPHLTALTALKGLSREIELVGLSLAASPWRTFLRVTVPACAAALADLWLYLFLRAMTTLSAVIFLYTSQTKVAAIAVIHVDETGATASAAAMAMLIVYACLAVRLLHHLVTERWLLRWQRWRMPA